MEYIMRSCLNQHFFNFYSVTILKKFVQNKYKNNFIMQTMKFFHTSLI